MQRDNTKCNVMGENVTRRRACFQDIDGGGFSGKWWSLKRRKERESCTWRSVAVGDESKP